MKPIYLLIFLFIIKISYSQPVEALSPIIKLNREEYQKISGSSYIKKDGTKATFIGMLGYGALSLRIEEYPPVPNILLQVKKVYYNNDILESEKKYFSKVLIGRSRYYDENGKLIKEVDEDAKFGAIKPQDIIDFLDREGYINKQTGEIGINKEGSKYSFIKIEFNPESNLWFIYIEGGREYTPREIEKIEELSTIKNEDGSLGYDNYLFPDSYTYTYEIDGETGKVLSNNLALDPRDVFKTYQGKEYTWRQWDYYRDHHRNQLLEEGEYFGDKEEPYPVQKRKETP
ncbi:hypothetical protein ETU08_03995 [Apibacter muscae]|uniref:hypothetical protein n=1 Tax=Apibacter muscae TaxID=2509004 RepID=UPI0011ABDEE1|nr:hypothetical protein [Apibacter muscae]TWP30761.1 hypothetical protein ETU08_03995 [Apibacter muscae]